nr:hypothetical protein [Tsukamurella tyrosinosolvens]
MLALTVAGTAIDCEAILHSLEYRLGDHRLVAARVLDAAQGDDTDVIAVGQHAVDVAALDRTLRLLGGRAECESAGVQEVGHAAESHVGVGCVLVECPAHVVCAFGVYLDLSGLAAVHDGTGVEVSDRRAAQRSATLDFLLHTLHNFLSEVRRVEFGDSGEDSVDQLALR